MAPILMILNSVLKSFFLITTTFVIANLWILNQFNKGIKSCITGAIFIKLNVHSCAMTIHTCFQFHEIPLYVCLVTTPFVDFNAIQGQ